MRNFRLQTLLDVKTWRERERAAALEGARAAVANADAALAQLQAMRTEHLSRLQREIGAGRSAGELLNLRGVLEQLEHLIMAAQQDRALAHGVLGDTISAYTQATTERRSFEKLKERHVDAARKAVDTAERASLDEIGLRRHALRTATGGGA